MVDLTLTSVDVKDLVAQCKAAGSTESAEKDIYVTVRVGDSQKLGRLSNERVYKFVAGKGGTLGRFAKVEVLQKVASTTIDLNKEDVFDEVQKMCIPLSSGTGNVKFDVALKKFGVNEAPDPLFEKKSPTKRPATATRNTVKKYLDDHRLEARLKDAMQEVLRFMPDDPAMFFAEKLTNKKLTSLPATAPAGNATEPAKLDGTEPAKLDGTFDIEALRQQAKATLLEATSSTKLHDALSDVKTKQEDAKPAGLDLDTLRMQAKNTLLEATNDGKLEEALLQANTNRTDMATSEDVNELRQQARASLLKATETGALEEALNSVKNPADPEGFGYEVLRKQAKDTFLEAARNGKLEEALVESAKKSQDDGGKQMSDVENLAAVRAQAKQTLLQAGLDLASKESGKDLDAVDVREQAKQTFLQAAESGVLDEALSQVKALKSGEAAKSKLPDVESMRAQARKNLLEAAESGLLGEALGKVKASNSSETDVESLRAQAKQTLLEATDSGVLDQALSQVKAPKPKKDTNQLREQARDTLITATHSGQLDAAFEEMKAAKAVLGAAGGNAAGATDVQKDLAEAMPALRDPLGEFLKASPFLGEAISKLPAEDKRVSVYKEIEKKVDIVSTIWEVIKPKVEAYDKSGDSTMDLANAMPAIKDPLRDLLEAMPAILSMKDEEPKDEAVTASLDLMKPKVDVLEQIWKVIEPKIVKEAAKNTGATDAQKDLAEGLTDAAQATAMEVPAEPASASGAPAEAAAPAAAATPEEESAKVALATEEVDNIISAAAPVEEAPTPAVAAAVVSSTLQAVAAEEAAKPEA